MDQLWAPWRLSYVAQPAKPQPTAPAEACFLCRAVRETADRENFVVHRTALSISVLNRFPYNNGHVLVSPLRHVATLADLTAAESADLQSEIVRLTRRLDQIMTPDGYNVGLNLGSAAGAGVPGHLHWHVVPRWTGDVNFMPMLADTKVIVQSLDLLWERLTARSDP
jgi:ATP adenylyltransferase